jgi:Uma2 family endonuclease
MTLAAPEPRFTPDDVLRLKEEGLYELVSGRLVEKKISPLVSEVMSRVAATLVNFGKSAKTGDAVYIALSFQCFAHYPDLVRRPEIAVIVADRLATVPEDGHVPIAPDLAVEVVSPDETMYEFEQRLGDYQEAKIPLVWEVNPKFRFVRIHRLNRDAERLNESAILTADPVLPGFSVLVSELFPPAGNAKP